MKIDFHCHTLISRKAVFDNTLFDKTINQSKKMGLDAIVMTEHMSAKYFEQILDYLDLYYPYKNIYYHINDFRLYIGMEVDLKTNGHILVMGHKNDIVCLRRRLLNKYPNSPSLEQFLTEARDFETFIVGAHPYMLTGINTTTLKQLDALDMNGKDLRFKRQIENLSKTLNLPLVGGSDTHLYIQAGVTQTCLDKSFETIAELKQLLNTSPPKITSHPLIKFKIKLAGYVKKRIKKRILDNQYLWNS
ncbi:MAG: hypothetical protein BEN18_04400 [Epulopiscium sp. Nuni2H_MBin001]|nr:MAG: hypothetical protein BEN18_04400 [Epulopiscium sp. Nuni2H_MBin001]